MFKNADYSVVQFILHDKDATNNQLLLNMEEYLQCPHCEKAVKSSEYGLDSDISISKKCTICNQIIAKTYYQCIFCTRITCKDCCVAMTMYKLLKSCDIYSPVPKSDRTMRQNAQLFFRFMKQELEFKKEHTLALTIKRMFDIDTMGEYYDPSTILFHLFKKAQYFDLELIEQIVKTAPKIYINRKNPDTTEEVKCTCLQLNVCFFLTMHINHITCIHFRIFTH